MPHGSINVVTKSERDSECKPAPPARLGIQRASYQRAAQTKHVYGPICGLLVLGLGRFQALILPGFSSFRLLLSFAFGFQLLPGVHFF